jgi:hypothetical protein
MMRPLLDELSAIIKVALRIGPTWDPTASRQVRASWRPR